MIKNDCPACPFCGRKEVVIQSHVAGNVTIGLEASQETAIRDMMSMGVNANQAAEMAKLMLLSGATLSDLKRMTVSSIGKPAGENQKLVPSDEYYFFTVRKDRTLVLGPSCFQIIKPYFDAAGGDTVPILPIP